MKLLKIPRVFRISHLWKLLESGGQGAFYVQWGLRVLSLTFFLTIIVHWVTCLWNVVVDVPVVAPGEASSPSQWYQGLIERGYWSNSTVTWECSRLPSGYSDACPFGEKYSACLYFCVLMLLGNDVYPTSHIERTYAASTSLLGAIVQAYVLGQVTMLISNLTVKTRKWQEKMDNIAEVMRYMNIEPDIQRQVRLYFDYAFHGGGAGPNSEWMEFATSTAIPPISQGDDIESALFQKRRHAFRESDRAAVYVFRIPPRGLHYQLWRHWPRDISSPTASRTRQTRTSRWCLA